MDLLEAAKERHSVRQYTDRRIEGEVRDSLQKEINRLNELSGMSMRLVLDEPNAFGGLLLKATTHFKNAVNYIAVSGPESEDLDWMAGYYGEQAVLFAQTLGLNTCWAMMAKKSEQKGGVRNVINISVGYGETQGVPHRSKPVEKIADISDAPEWFRKGVECAMLAPTGLNKQAFNLERDGNRVRIGAARNTLKQVDMGIAKFHFELGAGKENFEWA